MPGLITELKRRNVFRVAIAYVVVAWLMLQVVDIVIPILALPDWVAKFLLLVILVGFPFAILLAWAFELTPGGLKREKDVDRSQSVTPQTGRKLDRVIIIVLVLAVGFLMTDKFLLKDRSGTDAIDTPSEISAAIPADLSIAVLPFVNMSGDKENEYFADGLSEELLNKLTRVPDLKVTGRTSSFAYKDQSPNLQEVGQTLGVANILEGSVRRQKNKVRITAQLVRATDGFHLWSDTYDRSMDDVFAIQDEIAQSVADALNIVLDENAMQQMRNSGVREVDAFIAYQKGVELYQQAHGSQNLLGILELAVAQFDEAIRLAPDFSSAYFLGSDYYAHKVFDLRLPREERVAALEQFQTRLANAFKHAQDSLRRAFIDIDRVYLSDDWRTMLAKFDRAILLDGCADPVWFELVNVIGDRAKKATAVYERLHECDPLDPVKWTQVANSYLMTGQPEKAMKQLDAIQDKFGRDDWRGSIYTQALLVSGQTNEALEIAKKLEAPDAFFSNAYITALAVSGNIEAARAELDKTLEVSPYDPASIPAFAVIGDRENVNRIAKVYDEQPGGPAMLLGATYACMCGAPFDIDEVPNFRRQLEESGIPWPPEPLIDFPAKDW